MPGLSAEDLGTAVQYARLPEKGFDRLHEESVRMGISIDRAAIIILCPILDDDTLYEAYLGGKKTANKPAKNGKHNG